MFVACTPSAKQMSALLEEHPEILANAIEKNPDQFMASVQKAAQGAQSRAQENAAKAEELKFEEELKNPLKPEIDDKRAMMGEVNAPITIVEYTDFQCPYCSQGYKTLEQVRKIYGNKVRVLVKSLPLPMHPLAMPAALRFEALRIQNAEKAFAFYHEIFSDQRKLNSGGEKYLDAVAKKVGADTAKLKKDMNSDVVRAIIDKDMAEAEKFGISGTPGFIVDGVSIRGAYPFETFQKIIDRKLAANK
ncbi:MAG: thioredoxin domain-containing protein [Bdellovibrionaceae bacterium]|nr:thioredoxin domain-containing protein [Pseudobdellovibrionaceae bacterium]